MVQSLKHVHVCVLNKRVDPLNGGELRWSMPYDQICQCEGTTAHAYKRPAAVCEEPDQETHVALWFTDNLTQITSHKNWNISALDRLLNRTDYCGKLLSFLVLLTQTSVQGSRVPSRVRVCVKMVSEYLLLSQITV